MYKRQVQHRFFYFFQKTIWIDFDFATNDILLVSKFYKYGLFYIGVVLAACADNADPVSYTHLDVYKRQMLH